MNSIRILAFGSAFALLCLLSQREIAPLAASAADQTAAVVSTFPDDLQGIWPGKDGSFLAQTENKLYLVKANGKFSEIATFDTTTHLPSTTSGWSPTNLALAVRPKEAQFNTPWSMQLVLPGPRRIIPNAKWDSYVDLFAPANMIFIHRGTPDGDLFRPHSYKLEARNLAGKIIPGWKVTELRDYRTQFAFIGGKARVAVAGSSPEKTTIRLLDEKARPLWSRRLDKDRQVLTVGISASTRTLVLPTDEFSKPPFQTTPNGKRRQPAPPPGIVWLLNARNGAVLARLQYPGWHIQGMQLSANGKWAAIWSNDKLSLIDIARRRRVWKTQLANPRLTGPRNIFSADVRNDGRVVAGYQEKISKDKKPDTIYVFNDRGFPNALWKATESPLLRTSLFLSPDERRVIFCSGKQALSIAMPAAKTK